MTLSAMFEVMGSSELVYFEGCKSDFVLWRASTVEGGKMMRVGGSRPLKGRKRETWKTGWIRDSGGSSSS